MFAIVNGKTKRDSQGLPTSTERVLFFRQA